MRNINPARPIRDHLEHGADNWRDRAECAKPEHDPETWFPIYTGTDRATQVDAYRPAYEICRDCPVRAACLDEALRDEGTSNSNKRYGMRGGLTPAQRETAIRKKREARKKSASVRD